MKEKQVLKLVEDSIRLTKKKQSLYNPPISVDYNGMKKVEKKIQTIDNKIQTIIQSMTKEEFDNTHLEFNLCSDWNSFQ